MQLRCTTAPGYSISHHVSRIRYGTYLVLHLGDTHSGRLVDSSLLGYRLSCGAIQHIQDPDSQSAQDHSTRCDVLFSGYLHFTSRARDVDGIRKCKDTVINSLRFA